MWAAAALIVANIIAPAAGRAVLVAMLTAAAVLVIVAGSWSKMKSYN